MRVLLVALALLSSSCATVMAVALPQPPPHIDCHARQCPTQAELEHALGAFHAAVPAFDPSLPLEVEWHASDEVFRSYLDAAGQRHLVVEETPNGGFTRVTSWSTLAHGLMHIRYWRTHHVGESDHETPPGPWTAADNKLIEVVKHQMEPPK